MVKLIDNLMKDRIMKKGSKLIEASDYCAAHFWCTTAFYFKSALVLGYETTVDQSIRVPVTVRRLLMVSVAQHRQS